MIDRGRLAVTDRKNNLVATGTFNPIVQLIEMDKEIIPIEEENMAYACRNHKDWNASLMKLSNQAV